MSITKGRLDIGYSSKGFDTDREPEVVGTAVLPLTGLVHLDPPCWPTSWPAFCLVMKTRVRAALGSVAVYLEQEQEPVAMVPDVAAGIVAGIVIAAERIGRREEFDDLVDQICIDMRRQAEEHPQLLDPVKPHDPATCDCPPYLPPDEVDAVADDILADAQGDEGEGS